MSNTILDFDIDAIMRLSNVKRWGVVEMSKSQSVAEHSYNVVMISIMIAENLDEPRMCSHQYNSVMYFALVHDLPELITGDIPTSIKKYVDSIELNYLTPKYGAYHDGIKHTLNGIIVKSADILEALQFAERFCIDSRRSVILMDLKNQLNDYLTTTDVHIRVADAINRMGS